LHQLRRFVTPYLLSSFWRQIERQCYNSRSFPNLKSASKGTRFESVEAVKTKSTEVFKGIARKGLPTLFRPVENTDGKLLKIVNKK